MERIILVLVFLAITFPVTAGNLEIPSSLSATQRAELVIQAEKMANAAGPLEQAKAAKEWVEVGTALGEGLAGAAKALGTEVNEFSDTTVGKTTMFVIVWRYLGGDLVGLLFGFVWFFTAIPIWFYLYRRTFVIKSITYNQKGEGPRKIVEFQTEAETSRYSDAFKFMFFFAGVLITLVGLVPILSIG